MCRCMRTTLTLDDDVAVLLEKLRKKRDATLKEVVNDALRLGLSAIESPESPSQPFRIRARPMGALIQIDNVAEAITLIEGDGYR